MSMAYPKGETVWVSYYSRDGTLLYIITSKALRDVYFAYEVKDGRFSKIGRAKNPVELEKNFKRY